MQFMKEIQQHLNAAQAMCIVACSLDGNLNTQNLFNWVGNTDGTKDAFAKEMASNPAVAKFKSDFWDGMFPQFDTDLAPG